MQALSFLNPPQRNQPLLVPLSGNLDLHRLIIHIHVSCMPINSERRIPVSYSISMTNRFLTPSKSSSKPSPSNNASNSLSLIKKVRQGFLRFRPLTNLNGFAETIPRFMRNLKKISKNSISDLPIREKAIIHQTDDPASHEIRVDFPGLNTPSRCSLTYLWNWSKSFE